MANLLSTSVSGSLSSTGRISTTYNTDRYQFNLARSSGSNWWFTNDSDKLGLHLNNVGDRIYFATDGNIWSSYYNDWLSNIFNSKQNASTAITTSNIGSQSVSYASSAGNADTVDGYHSNTVGNRHHTARGFYVDGDQNTYYPVLIQGSGNYAFNRYSIYRAYGWEAPWDPIGTGAHKGGLTFDVEWSGDIAWGGNDKTLRVVQFAESYTTMVAGMTLPVTGGLCVWLRGGHAYYEIQVDAYPTTPTVYLDGFTAANGAQFLPRTDTSNVQSEIYNRMPIRSSSELYDGGNRVITSGNIGSQSVNYAISSTRLYASDSPYRIGDSNPYYMYMNYDGGSYWELKVSPATPGTVKVAYSNSSGNADTLDSLDSSEFARGRASYQVLNLDTIKQPGLYQYDGGIGGTQPEGADQANLRTIEIGSGGRYSQMAFDWNSEQAWFRRQTGSTWSAWREFIHSGNISSQSVSYATSAGDASTLGGYGRGNTTNKIAYWDSTRNLYVNNPESYSGEVRLGAAWNRGGVYASGTLTMSTSSGALDFVSNDTTVGAFRWDSTNGSRFIVGQNVTTTPYTLIDTNRRPVIYARGAYPVLTLDHTETGNSAHGPTIQFVHNGLDGRQFVIGTNGTGTFLDFGYSDTPSYGNTNYNPHHGIAGYTGKTIMRLTTTGLLVGDAGTYPTIRTAARDLDVRGSQNISGFLNVNGATEHTVNDNGSVIHGTTTNNRVFINGSIQLTNNNDAIVIGRGASTFLTDEELGFGWGGGWYMTESSYIRSRGSKSLHMNGGSVDYVGSIYIEGSGTYAHLQPNSASYGTLQITNSKNGWAGIRFTAYNTNIMSNTNESGFFHNDYGWQIYWYNGTLYCYKNANGGGTQATVLDSSNAAYAWNMNQYVRTSDPVTFAAYFLPQNPVGTTYGNGVSATPPNRIEQRVGDNDGWRIYGEAGATNEVRMVFELIDDIETAYSDQWVFRNKLTYGAYTARNEFQISGNGDAQARGSMRAPIFYSSVDTNYFWEPNVSSAHRFRTANGYVDIGPMNGSWCHFQTDRANFYFGSTIYADASGFATYGGSTSMTKTDINSPIFLVPNHSDNTKGYRIYNTSNSSVSAMFVNSSNQLVLAAGAVDQINLNKKVYVNGVALGVNVAPSATAGRIDASNDIVAYSSSDERLKHNIAPIENALDKVKSLTGVEFDWKPEYKHAHGYEGHDTGIIAQQVAAVMPSAVRTNDTGFLAVRYEKLIGLLIEGMKEQQAQIDELKAKLDGLTK